MTIRVSRTATCPWFQAADALEAFAFEWPLVPDRTLECTVARKLVRVVSTYRTTVHEDDAIYMERRLADVEDARIAFHDALFVSEVLGVQRAGFATEMLRRCIPYYRRIEIRSVIIPSAVEAGRLVWPKFGFRPAADISARFAKFVADLHIRRVGTPLPDSVPTAGPAILRFRGEYGLAVGALALQTFPGLVLELDLLDPGTVDSLNDRGIIVP
jgi:hypothetical protein